MENDKDRDCSKVGAEGFWQQLKLIEFSTSAYYLVTLYFSLGFRNNQTVKAFIRV